MVIAPTLKPITKRGKHNNQNLGLKNIFSCFSALIFELKFFCLWIIFLISLSIFQFASIRASSTSLCVAESETESLIF